MVSGRKMAHYLPSQSAKMCLETAKHSLYRGAFSVGQYRGTTAFIDMSLRQELRKYAYIRAMRNS